MKKHMHQNSLSAYAAETAHLNERERLIFDFMRQQTRPMTDRQVMRSLGFAEPNAVRPRITALVNDHNLLEEIGQIKCPETNRLVRTVQVVSRKYEPNGQSVML